jgi:hypothetical protein
MSAELKVRITGDNTGFSGAVNGAKGIARGLTRSLSGSLGPALAGAFSVAAVTALTKETIEYASHLRDITDILKVNVEWFQRMTQAAKRAGSSEDDLFAFMSKLQTSRAKSGSDPQGAESRAFGKLGFKPGEVSGAGSLSAQDFMTKLAAALRSGGTEAEEAAKVVGGKTGRKLIQALKDGIDKGAGVMTDDMVDRLDDLGDVFTDLKTTLMVDLAPAIIWVVYQLKNFIDWVKKVGGAAGAYIGTRSTGGLVKDIGVLANPASFLIDKALGIKDENMDDAESAAGQEIIKADEEKKKEDDAREAARKARRAARDAANKGGVEADDIFTKDRGKSIKREADSLSKLGLFTAAGLVGNQQLNVSQQQLQALRRIDQNTKPKPNTNLFPS